MSQELQKFEGMRVILMRSSLVHWLKADTAERVRTALQQQTGHSFIAITELGITINTADISGVYTLAEYDDLMKVQQGMFQCIYKKWHAKKEVCQCAAEERKTIAEKMRKQKLADETRELSPEELEANLKRIREMGAELRANGTLGGSGHMPVKGRACVMCDARCPTGSRWYCSGECLTEAKRIGIYGREEEHLKTKAKNL